jgi:hypothetical protein
MRLKSAVLILALTLLAAGCGEIPNPFAKAPIIVPTAVPADFAIVVDQATELYYARQTTHQVITASDMMSRTTYTYYRDYNNTIARQFTTEYPVNAAQLQAMWNKVQKFDLLAGASTWYYWSTDMDAYRVNERVMEIKANGKSQSYKQLNHFGYKLRDLALDVEAARLPLTQAGSQPATAPAVPTAPAATGPATADWIEIKPTTLPATLPSTLP